jgi:hypothetical protein
MRAIALDDRDILTGDKPLIAKVKAARIVLITFYVIVKFPLTPGRADHMPEIVFLACAVMHDTTQVAMRFPQFPVDPACVLQRHYEIVAVLFTSPRVARLARETQPDLNEAYGKPLVCGLPHFWQRHGDLQQ